MADRFPLIANTSANQIQELPSGDNLNLIGNSIIGVSTIGVGTITASNIGVGAGVTIEANGQAGFAGTITASSFVKTDGSAIGGGGLTGGGSDQLFVESDNVMSSDFTTGTNKNYLNLLPLTINATLTVTDGSFIQFVSA